MRPLGQKIVKMLHEANFDTHPILIHLFSNGGAYLYQHIDLAIRDLQSPIHVSEIDFSDLSALANHFYFLLIFFSRSVGWCLIRHQVIAGFWACSEQYRISMGRTDVVVALCRAL